MTCNHTRETRHWVDDDWAGDGWWEYSTQYTTVDIDLHRFKCTQCGEIMYYSGRAREHFEEGKIFKWITGLDK